MPGPQVGYNAIPSRFQRFGTTATPLDLNAGLRRVTVMEDCWMPAHAAGPLYRKNREIMATEDSRKLFVAGLP
ncbi:MAG TPA: hypothetical protein VGK73_07870, partial [Polyangiaceae bacterium]